MASVTYGVNDPLAVKLWSKKLTVEALKATWLQKFMGRDDNSLIQIKDETSKSPGDTITVGLRMQATGAGVAGDGTLDGNEEALVTYTDKIIINQLRHAARSAGRVTQQRVPFDIREEMLGMMKDWWADRIDGSGFNQLCGYVPQTDTRFTGMMGTLAADANHYLNAANYPGGLASPANNDTDVVNPTFTDSSSNTQSAKFSLAMLDRAKERAKTLTPAIRPIKIKGRDFYVAFLHPYQVTDMRQNANPGQWLDIQKAAMTGGLVENNPIFDGSLGVYNGIILHEDYRVTQGYNPTGNVAETTVRRAVLCGAQAGMIAFGRNNSIDRMNWVEELFDYENQLGVSAGMIWALKKSQYNSADFGTVIMSSYAAQH